MNFIINIRSQINRRKIKYYVTRFLSSEIFKNRYIRVETIVFTNSSRTNIGNEYYLDTKNVLDIKSFTFLLQQNFLTLKFEDEINKFVFEYSEIKRSEYIEHKNKKFINTDSTLTYIDTDSVSIGKNKK